MPAHMRWKVKSTYGEVIGVRREPKGFADARNYSTDRFHMIARIGGLEKTGGIFEPLL